MAECSEPRKAALKEAAHESGGSGLFFRQMEQLEALSDEIRSKPDRLLAGLRDEVSKVIENANIIPAAVRDLAHRYLESRRPGFKAGFLTRASRNEQVRTERLEAFHKAIAEQVQAQLDWHILDTIRKKAVSFGFQPAKVSEALDSLQVPLTPGWLADQVQSGAMFTNEYTMNYSKSAAAEIKSMYRKKAFGLIDNLAMDLHTLLQPELTRAEREMAEIREKLGAFYELEKLEKEESAYIDSLLSLAVPATVNPPAVPKPELLDNPGPDEADKPLMPGNGLYSPDGLHIVAPQAQRAREAAGENQGTHRDRMKQTAQKLLRGADIIEDIPALSSLVRSMREKGSRMVGNTFTIALFGAFSAGKSSFANASSGKKSAACLA